MGAIGELLRVVGRMKGWLQGASVREASRRLHHLIVQYGWINVGRGKRGCEARHGSVLLPGVALLWHGAVERRGIPTSGGWGKLGLCQRSEHRQRRSAA